MSSNVTTGECTIPTFGIFPGSGSISVGMDGNLAVWTFSKHPGLPTTDTVFDQEGGGRKQRTAVRTFPQRSRGLF